MVNGERKSGRLPPDGEKEHLHIAAVQRIVGKQLNDLRMPLEMVRYWIEKAATDQGGTTESKDLERIRDHLQCDLGLEIDAVLELTKRWPT